MRSFAFVVAGFAVACSTPSEAPAVDAGAISVSEVALLGGPPSPISDEMEVDAPAYLPDPSSNDPRDIAFNGQDWVVAYGYYEPRLARVTRDGAVRDPVGVLVDGDGSNARMSLASDGHHVAAVYATEDPVELRWQRFDRDLTPVGAPLTLAAAADRSGFFDAAIAFGDGVYLVAWTDFAELDVKAVRISADGRVLDSTPLSIAATSGFERTPTVTWGGNVFLVTWNDGDRLVGTLRAARVTAAGLVIDGGLPIAASTRIGAKVAFGDGVFTATWARTATPAAVLARRIAPNLSFLDESPLVVAATDQPAQPDVAWAHDGFLLTWTSSPDNAGAAHVRTLSATGAFGDPVVLARSGLLGYAAVIGSDGERALALWWGSGTRLSARAEILDAQGITVANQIVAQRQPAIATGADGYLTAWIDERPLEWRNSIPLDSRGNVYVARVNAEGGAVEPRATALPRVDGWSSGPQVAFDGRSYLVVWRQQVQDPHHVRIRGVRVGADGAVLDAEPLTIVDRAGLSLAGISVAGSPEGFLVVWEQESDVLGRLITASGTLSGPAFPISAATGGQYEPRVVFSAEGHFLVAWHDWRDDEAIATARVSPTGQVLDLQARRVTRSGNRDGFGLAVGDGGAYVAWTRWEDGAYLVRGTWLDAEGTSRNAEGDVLATSPRWLTGAQVAFDGSSFVVSWARDTSGLAGEAIDVTRVTADGVPMGGTLPLAASVASGTAKLASIGAGRTIAVYSRDDQRRDYGGERVRTRRIEPLPAAASCEASAACADGACVDGVCCTSACGGGADDCQACSRAAGAASDGTCGVVARGHVCRAAAGDCDVAEVCDGEAVACPIDAAASDGTTCSDGDMCVTEDRCEGGECISGAPPECAPAETCMLAGECDPETGGCVQVPVHDGTRCDDGDACTLEESCHDGACTPGTRVVCPPAAECQAAGVCQATTGACAYAPLPDGSPCSVGTCQSGACAAPPDASVDAGPDVPSDAAIDAGSSVDATTDRPDATLGRDATPRPEPEPEPDDDGCGCRSSEPSSMPATCMLAIAVAALLRRSKRRSPR